MINNTIKKHPIKFFPICLFLTQTKFNTESNIQFPTRSQTFSSSQQSCSPFGLSQSFLISSLSLSISHSLTHTLAHIQPPEILQLGDSVKRKLTKEFGTSRKKFFSDSNFLELKLFQFCQN